ncbi:MAG: hypothetical protein Q8L60_10800 [Gammaproteobacteria bacterium]|nr:hypothetical protein [Gammaproteobacteria bacterium]MDP2346836.1 hypothetical protein [Gammaproteobacteria bacterium]
MNNKEFKAAAVASLLSFKERVGVKTVALDLYEIYGMKKGIDTWQRHISACFDPDRPEFFDFCDVVNMCRLYGIHEPLFFMCNALGYERPQHADGVETELKYLRLSIAEARLQLEEKESRMRELELSAGSSGDAGVARFSRS